MQSKWPSVQLLRAPLRPMPTAVISTSSSPISSTMLLRWFSSSSTTSSRFTRLSMNVRDLAERLVERVLVDRLLEVGDRAGLEPLLPLVECREMMCTGMCRVSGWCLSRSSTAHPSMPGMSMSSVIASGLYSCASCDPGLAVERDEALEALLARHVEQDRARS